MSTTTITRTRNARGQFVAVKPETPKPTAPKPTVKPAPKVSRKVTTRKPTVTAEQAERNAQRAARIETLAAGLTVQQARIALAQAQREVRRIERTGEKGWVRANAKASTAAKVLALVESRQPVTTVRKRDVAAALASALAPATARSRRSAR